jgi:hypothetical protein
MSVLSEKCGELGLNFLNKSLINYKIKIKSSWTQSAQRGTKFTEILIISRTQ